MDVSLSQEFLIEYFGGGVNAESLVASTLSLIVAKELLWDNVNHWAEKAKMVIFGNNFGRNDSAVVKSVSFVSGSSRFDATVIRGNHTYLEVFVPPGEGATMIRVNIENNENENVANVEYLPPIIEVLEFPESNGKYMAPTTGCVEYADELNEGSGARICKEGKSAKMYVRGENFGVSKPSVVITDMTGRETICKVTKYSHYEVIIDLPEGFGPASLTIFSVQPGLIHQDMPSRQLFSNIPPPMLTPFLGVKL